MRIKDKIVLITGANKGIGLAITMKFLDEGAIVFGGIRNAEEVSPEIATITKKYPAQFFNIQLDVTSTIDCKTTINTIKKQFGRLDVLVNNAGVVSYELLPFLNIDSFEKMLNTNIVGLIGLTQYATRLMSRQESGSIINISSIVAVKGVAGQSAYAASKGAVNSFTLSIAKELANQNIRVNAIAPGMVATDRLLAAAQGKFDDKINQIGFKRMAQPEDVANLCLFLASDESSYITGQIIGLDGSFVI